MIIGQNSVDSRRPAAPPLRFRLDFHSELTERDLQRQGAQQAEARAERAVELAQERVVPAHERL